MLQNLNLLKKSCLFTYSFYTFSAQLIILHIFKEGEF